VYKEIMVNDYFLRIGSARDISNARERFMYRLLEMFPGMLVWGTFLAACIFSWLAPVWVAVFILAFALYWIYKVIYLALHTRAAYAIMRKHQARNWYQALEELPSELLPFGMASWRDILHVIILPMYKEPYEVVRPALHALAHGSWPAERMVVVLATEDAAGEEAQNVARRLEDEFGTSFARFLLTVHPSNSEGEIPGKGANERWAGIKAKEAVDEIGIPYERVLVSSLDSDTVVYEHYFACLTHHYLIQKDPLHASYQPVPLFINNIWEAPAISRIIAFSSTFWHVMNQERPEKHLTFSSHSMPFKALVEIGFWQPNVVSEDSRIFWQCFFHYNGNWRVVSLYYPVQMDANVAHSFWRTLQNLYKQQRRWAYGVADVPYAIFGWWKKRKEISFGAFWQYIFPVTEGFYSWATHAVLLFALGWMPLILGGEEFRQTLFSYNLPRVTRTLLTIAMVGLVSSAYLSIRILPPRPPSYGKWRYAMMIIQWFLIPFSLILFGALPAIEAQTRLMFGKYLGFFVTEKHRKNIP
jgi:hypothetical protein